MNNTLLTGSQHSGLEQVAFDRADQVADDLLGSVLYLTRNDGRGVRLRTTGPRHTTHSVFVPRRSMRSSANGRGISTALSNRFPDNWIDGSPSTRSTPLRLRRLARSPPNRHQPPSRIRSAAGSRSSTTPASGPPTHWPRNSWAPPSMTE